MLGPRYRPAIDLVLDGAGPDSIHQRRSIRAGAGRHFDSRGLAEPWSFRTTPGTGAGVAALVLGKERRGIDISHRLGGLSLCVVACFRPAWPILHSASVCSHQSYPAYTL